MQMQLYTYTTLDFFEQSHLSAALNSKSEKYPNYYKPNSSHTTPDYSH